MTTLRAGQASIRPRTEELRQCDKSLRQSFFIRRLQIFTYSRLLSDHIRRLLLRATAYQPAPCSDLQVGHGVRRKRQSALDSIRHVPVEGSAGSGTSALKTLKKKHPPPSSERRPRGALIEAPTCTSRWTFGALPVVIDRSPSPLDPSVNRCKCGPYITRSLFLAFSFPPRCRLTFQDTGGDAVPWTADISPSLWRARIREAQGYDCGGDERVAQTHPGAGHLSREPRPATSGW
jgi:hypothetical protein